MKMRLLPLLCLALGLPSGAFAQSEVVANHPSRTTTNVSGTLAGTGVFQSVFAASSVSGGNKLAPRRDCMIQNNSSTNVLYVYFGPIASADVSKSVKLQPGWAVNCATFNAMLADQVSVAGTAGDAFYAGSQ